MRPGAIDLRTEVTRTARCSAAQLAARAAEETYASMRSKDTLRQGEGDLPQCAGMSRSRRGIW